VQFTINGTLGSSTTTADDGIVVQIAYGTGTAPGNGAAATGTTIGGAETWSQPAAVTAADVHQPLTIPAAVANLVAGTAYWFDLQQKSFSTASSVGFISGMNCQALEQR
jgi:hypothetical protein